MGEGPLILALCLIMCFNSFQVLVSVDLSNSVHVTTDMVTDIPDNVAGVSEGNHLVGLDRAAPRLQSSFS